MSEIRVRLTDAGDMSAIASLRAQWTGARSGPEFEARVREWLTAEGDRRLIWLATLGDEPAGLASLLEYHRMPRPDRPKGTTERGCAKMRCYGQDSL